jgi:hypothetical protein
MQATGGRPANVGDGEGDALPDAALALNGRRPNGATMQ